MGNCRLYEGDKRGGHGKHLNLARQGLNSGVGTDGTVSAISAPREEGYLSGNAEGAFIPPHWHYSQ